MWPDDYTFYSEWLYDLLKALVFSIRYFLSLGFSEQISTIENALEIITDIFGQAAFGLTIGTNYFDYKFWIMLYV